MVDLPDWENEDSVTFCRLPDCRRVITFEPGEPSYEISRPGRGTYKTRSDRVFCRDRACKQKYHYRKKAGGLGTPSVQQPCSNPG